MQLKVKVLDSLGIGWSVQTICDKLGITYEDLCKLAQEDSEVYTQLHRWFPLYNFLDEKIEDKPLKTKKKSKKQEKVNDTEVSEVKDVSEGEQVSGQ